MQGFGMLRTPQKILKPKKHEKVLSRHLLPDIAKKAITQTLIPLNFHTKFSWDT